jgi:hypothetical protein
MKIWKKIIEEIEIILRTTTYFAVVFLILMVMKKLNLEDYHIEFAGLSQVLIGSLIMAKVIILMDLISLGKWVQRQPSIVDVTIRTLLYSAGVAIVVLLEKAFEHRHEVKGFTNAIMYVVHNRDFYHVWATTIGACGAILVYNSFTVVKRKLGEKGLVNLFFKTPLAATEKTTTPAIQ